MGCTKSKNRAAEHPSSPINDGQHQHNHHHQQRQHEAEHEKRDSGRQASIDGLSKHEQPEPDPLPAKTPMAPKDDSVVDYDKESHSEIDIQLPGDARAKTHLHWQGSCFSSAEVSASSSRRGVAFKVEPSFVAVGLKSEPGKANDSYGALNYSFYCMEHGRIQIYELGEMKYTHPAKYNEDSTLEIHLRAHPHTVEYLIDEEVVYKSLKEPPASLHFQVCFANEQAAVTDACYVMTGASGATAGGA